MIPFFVMLTAILLARGAGAIDRSTTGGWPRASALLGWVLLAGGTGETKSR